MNPFTFAVLAAACAFSLQRAHAADLPVNYNHVEYKQTGNTYKWTPLHGPTPSSGAGVVFRGPTGIDTVQPKISTLERLPYDRRGSVPDSQKLKVSSPFTKQSFGKALTLAGRLSWPIGVIMTAGEIFDYLQSLGLEDIKNGVDGIEAIDRSVGPGSKEYRGVYGTAVTGWASSASSACQAWLGPLISGTYLPNDQYSRTAYHSVAGSSCIYEISQYGLQGEFISKSLAPAKSLEQRTRADGVNRIVSELEIEDLIAQESGWPTAAARALQTALQTPGVTIQTEPPVVSGPSSIPGTTTTTTTQTQVAPGTTTPVASGTPGAQPATSKTTTTTTTNNTYTGNTVNTKTTTTTVTNITNNITNQTTDTTDKEETKEDDSEDESPTDTPLGDVPKLYERKYPDGLSGIWNAKSAEIKQTPLFTLASDLMPTGLTAGTCPAWKVDLSFSGVWGDYGMQDVSPPCWIWGIAKMIIIASALILARALVFGG